MKIGKLPIKEVCMMKLKMRLKMRMILINIETKTTLKTLMKMRAVMNH